MKSLAFAAYALHAIYGDVPVPLIRDFQDKAGLYATGEIDAATIRELRQAMIWRRYSGPAPLPRKHKSNHNHRQRGE